MALSQRGWIPSCLLSGSWLNGSPLKCLEMPASSDLVLPHPPVEASSSTACLSSAQLMCLAGKCQALKELGLNTLVACACMYVCMGGDRNPISRTTPWDPDRSLVAEEPGWQYPPTCLCAKPLPVPPPIVRLPPLPARLFRLGTGAFKNMGASLSFPPR